MDLVRSDPSLHIVGMPGLGFRLLQRAWPWVHPSRFVTLGERTVQAVDALYFPIVVGPSRMGDVPAGAAVSQPSNGCAVGTGMGCGCILPLL